MMTGLKKSQIDSYVSNNYALLHKVASDFVKRKKRTYDPALVVSESYIYIVKNKEKITSIGQLQAFFLSKINLEVSKQNSTINYLFRERTVELLGIERQDENLVLLEINHDIKRNSQKAQIELYRLSLTDKFDEIVFNAYFYKKKRTVRDFAGYFNLSKQTANDLINEMKNKIKNYGKV